MNRQSISRLYFKSLLAVVVLGLTGLWLVDWAEGGWIIYPQQYAMIDNIDRLAPFHWGIKLMGFALLPWIIISVALLFMRRRGDLMRFKLIHWVCAVAAFGCILFTIISLREGIPSGFFLTDIYISGSTHPDAEYIQYYPAEILVGLPQVRVAVYLTVLALLFFTYDCLRICRGPYSSTKPQK